MTLTHPSPTGLVSRTRPLTDAGDLLDALGRGGFAWLHHGGGLATAGAAARLVVGPGPGRFEATAARVTELLGGIDVDDPLRLPGTGPLAVGALPFSDLAAGELVVPAVVVGCAGGRAWVTETGPADDPGDRAPVLPGPAPSRLAVVDGDTRDGWTTAVGRALECTERAPLVKVVLARQMAVAADVAFDPRTVLDRLRNSHPSSFGYAVDGFVGASPELLVRRRGARVLSRPMAGTAARGSTPADDERLVAALLSSPKEAEEHALVVGAVRAALEPVCREVVAGARPEAVRLATVTHLATTVAGHLRPGPAGPGGGAAEEAVSGPAGPGGGAAEEAVSGPAGPGGGGAGGAGGAPSALAIAGLLHPTPAVAGLPQAHALAAIEELESFDRGLYAGPVGWVDARGDGDWAVALRCAYLEGRRARLAAGAGIVADSDPEAEWAETQAKLEPMLAALGPA